MEHRTWPLRPPSPQPRPTKEELAHWKREKLEGPTRRMKMELARERARERARRALEELSVKKEDS